MTFVVGNGSGRVMGLDGQEQVMESIKLIWCIPPQTKTRNSKELAPSEA
jgi:hypothetical protein